MILISGFLFCLSILVDANDTRKILLKNYKTPKSNKGAIKNEDIFPIFMDKTKSTKLIVLFVPLIIFVISCAILVLSWITPIENRLSYDQTYKNIFLILYILFGVVIGSITALKLKNY